MTEFNYDAAYEPAMPVCRVTIVAAATDRRVTSNAIMDTGADATIVPTRLLRTSAHVGYLRQVYGANGVNGDRFSCVSLTWKWMV